jgi:hypothetical protein
MKNKSSSGAAIGLDVGTSRIVVASRCGEDFSFRSQLNAFVAIPFSKMTEQTLKKEAVPHVVESGQILIYGNESERFADLFHLEARRPMSGGILNPGEPDGLTLVGRILETVADHGEGQRIWFSIPAPPLGSEPTVTYHEAAISGLLAGLGHEPHSINEGLAVIYAELGETNYTGIGVSFGGGLCNVCLAYLSAPLFAFSVPKAGDFIDTSVAVVANELATRVRIVKETAFRFNGRFTDKVQQALTIYYQDMIQGVVGGLRRTFENPLNVPKLGRAIPIVLSGGSVLVEGFRERFETALRAEPLPVQISDVILAADPLNTTAKGALVAALTEG